MIAYLISAYRDADHLARLVEVLNDGDADFYVHVDRNVDARPFERLLRDKVNFVPRHAVTWGGWGQVEYQKELLGAALASGIPYERFVLLSGQDYPVWSPARIRRYFREYAETEYIMGFNIAKSGMKAQRRRVTQYHFFRDAPIRSLWWRNKFIVASRYLMRWLPVRRPPYVMIGKRKAEVHAGSDYWALTHACARYVYDVLEREPQVAQYFRHTFVPSEMCVQTIVFSSPYAGNVVPFAGEYQSLAAVTPLHYIDYLGKIKVLTETDLPKILASGKMFCRKVVSQESDALVEAIERRWKK